MPAWAVRHYTNPLHVYCRLRDLGVGKTKALILAERWGRAIKKMEDGVMSIKNIIGNGKTFTAGLLSIVWGAGGWYLGIHEADVAVGFISAGLGTMGVGHKLEVVKQALSKVAPVVLVVLLAGMLSGCGKHGSVLTTWEPPAVCTNSTDSLLLKLPEPLLISKGLVYANVKLAQKYGYGPEAIKVIEEIDAQLVDGLTGQDFIAMVQSHVANLNEKYALELMLVADVVNLNVPVPLSACDIELIRLHLQRQKSMLQLFGGGK